jgi:hypothetical protein
MGNIVLLGRLDKTSYFRESSFSLAKWSIVDLTKTSKGGGAVFN